MQQYAVNMPGRFMREIMMDELDCVVQEMLKQLEKFGGDINEQKFTILQNNKRYMVTLRVQQLGEVIE